MDKDLQELIEISRYYGKDPRYVIAGGGNTSMKTPENIWVKRPGGGIPAEYYESLLGLCAKIYIGKDTQIRKEDIKCLG